MIKTIAVLICLIIIGVNCTNKSKDKVTPIHERSNNKVYYSQFFKSVEFVKLETSQECLMSRIEKLDVDDDRIFTFDSYLGMVFIFTREGKFVSKIGKKGGGPGEFSHPITYSLDRKRKHIHFLDVGTKMILIFDYDGNYLYKNRGMYAMGFEVINESSNLFYHYNFVFRDSIGKNIDYDVVILDNQGRMIKGFNVRTANRNLALTSFNNIYKTEVGDIYMVPIFDFSLFKITPAFSMRKETEFVFDNHPPHKLFADNNNVRLLLQELDSKGYPNRLCDLIVTEKYTYFYFVQNETIHQVFWNRKNKEVTVVNRENWENDIVMFNETIFYGAFDGGMVQANDATDFIKSYFRGLETPSKYENTLSKKTMENINKLVLSTSPDDNPILMFYYFK